MRRTRCPARAAGNALLDGGRQRAGQFGGFIAGHVIPGGHDVLGVRFEIPARAQLAADAPADRGEHRRDLGIGRGVGWHQPRREAMGGAIDKNALNEDQVVMEIGIE
jgi:hypothetical protein